MRALSLLLFTLACNVAGTGGDAVSLGGSDLASTPGGTIEPAPKLSATIVSGFAFDGRSGKPLASVSITTEPPLEALTTNQQGAYVIDAGQAFGRLTIRGARDGYVQRSVGCVTLKPGRAVIADVTLVKSVGASTAPCAPACDATSTCLDGVCVSKCNPPCGCVDRCTAAGACEPDPDAPPAGSCGAFAVALGAGVCECETGMVPTGDGRSCGAPASNASCPPGATLAASGACVCKPGFFSNPAGDACETADDIAGVTPLGAVTELRRFSTPGSAPRGLAFDGAAIWVGDALRRTIDDVASTRSVSLGPSGTRLVDLAAGPDGLFAVFTAELNASSQRPTLAVVDPNSGAITAIAANDFAASPGLAFDGLNLASLEDNRLVRRSLALGQIVSFSTIEAGTPPELSVKPPILNGTYSPPPVAYMALTGNRAITWEGSVFDGERWLVRLAVLNAAHPTRATRVDTLALDLGGSHVRGLDASGTTAWVLVDGAGALNGPTLPAIVELSLE